MFNMSGGIITDFEGNYLIVFGNESKKWSFPKGAKEHFDTNRMETAIREIEEETGLVLWMTKNIKNIKLQSIYKYYYFKIPYIKPNLQPTDTGEIKYAIWVSPSDLIHKYRHCNSDLRYFINKLL